MKSTPTLGHSPLESTVNPQQQEGGLPSPHSQPGPTTHHSADVAHSPTTGVQPQPAQPGQQPGQLQYDPSHTTRHQAVPQQVKLVTYIFSLCTYSQLSEITLKY